MTSSKSKHHYNQTHLRPPNIPTNSPAYHQSITDKQEGSLCFLFQNANGLSIKNQTSLRNTLELLRDYKVSYLGLQETKLNANHPTCTHLLRRSFSAYYPGLVPHPASNKTFLSDTLHQNGGLLTAVAPPFPSSTSVVTDPTATIQQTILTLNQIKISVFNIYIPVLNHGPNTSHTQTTNAIRMLNLARPDSTPNQYIYEYLSSSITEARRQGRPVIVGGDFNEKFVEPDPLSETLPTMSSTLTSLGLLLASAAPGNPTPPTYIRGRKTLDHIWVTPDLYDSITGYGYLPFHSVMTSDHRGVFVHVKLSRYRDNLHQPFDSRKLSSRNPASVVKYLDSLRRATTNYNLKGTIDDLMAKEDFDEDDARSLQASDTLYTRQQLVSEANLYKHKTKHSFSDELHELKCARRYWRKILWLSKFSSTHESLSALYPSHVPTNIDLPRNDVLSKLKETGLLLMECLSRQEEAREEHLRRRACLEPVNYESGNYKAIGNVDAMRRQEKLRKDWACIKAATRPRNDKTKSSLEIPSGVDNVKDMWETLKTRRVTADELVWSDVSLDEEAENKLIDWCALHFAQASTTPLASAQWTSRLDLSNPDNIIDEILSGDVPVTPEHEEIKVFLRSAQKKTSNKLDISLDFNHFKAFASKQQENKLSSPSGLHYGHMRSLAHDDDLLRLRFNILCLAFRHNIILERWKTIWETLLPKEPPRNYIHRFRNITIVEWDLQYLMKTIWSKRLMSHVQHLLHPSQNATAGKVPQSSVLSHKLALNIMFIKGEKSVINENDASNCYDRILVPIAALACLRVGLPENAACFMTSFLSQAKHFLLRSGVQSCNHFAHTPEVRVDGTGQGTGWSPPLWTLVADILITSMAEYAGMYISAPDGSSSDLRQIEMYVDDAFQNINESGVLFHNLRTEEQKSLLDAARQAVQGFERQLSLSGGKLALEKTVFYYLVPYLDGTRRRYRSSKECPMELKVTENFNGEPITLRQLDADTPHKMLGIYTEPADTNTRQILVLRKKCRQWNNRMIRSSLTNRQKWMSYAMALRPALEYCLPAMMLDETTFQSILSPALSSIKHALSLSSKSPTQIIFFPSFYGGFDVRNMWVQHLAVASKFIVQHVRNSDSCGVRIQALLAYHQLEAGISAPFEILLGTKKGKYLTDTVLSRLLGGLKKLDLTICAPYWSPPPGRTVMEEFLNHEDDTGVLIKLNICRMRAKVHYITDMVTLDGNELLPRALRGETRSSNWCWPDLEPPSSWWHVWESYVRSYILPVLPISVCSPSDHQIFPATISRCKEVVEISGIKYSVNSSRRRPVLMQARSEIQCPLPCDLTGSSGPRRALRPGQRIVCAPLVHTPPPPPDFLLLHNYLRHLPTSPEDCDVLRSLAINGELHLACDGSAKDGDRSTFAVCLSSTDMTAFHLSSHEVVGLPHDSGRSELLALLVLVAYTSTLLQGIPDLSVNLYSDSLESLRFARDPYLGRTPAWADKRNIDFKIQLKQILANTTIQFCFLHVKSHQDDENNYEDLSLPAQLNYHCDRSARGLLTALTGPSPTLAPLDGDSTCLVDRELSGRVTRPFIDEITERRYGEEVRSHLALDQVAFQDIAWGSLSLAMKDIGSTSLKKVVWGQNPCRQRLHLSGKHPSPLCPLCGQVDRLDHFIDCPMLRLHPCVQENVAKLQSEGNKENIPDPFINLVCGLLNGERQAVRHVDDNIRARQKSIGWRHFLRGRLTRLWAATTPRNENRISPQEWLRKLARFVLRGLLMKWTVRCTIVSEASETVEKKVLLSTAQGMWEERVDGLLLAQDRHLNDNKNKPKEAWTPNELRNWIRTRELALDTAKKLNTTRQSLMTSWLLPKASMH